MSPSEFLRNSSYGIHGELSTKELVNLAVVENYSAAVQTIKKIWEDNRNNAMLKTLLNSLFEYIGEYVELVGQFNLVNHGKEDLTEIARIDSARTIKHNALMDEIKIINRYLLNQCRYNKGILPKGVYLNQRESITLWAKEIFIDLAEIKRELN